MRWSSWIRAALGPDLCVIIVFPHARASAVRLLWLVFPFPLLASLAGSVCLGKWLFYGSRWARTGARGPLLLACMSISASVGGLSCLLEPGAGPARPARGFIGRPGCSGRSRALTKGGLSHRLGCVSRTDALAKLGGLARLAPIRSGCWSPTPPVWRPIGPPFAMNAGAA